MGKIKAILNQENGEYYRWLLEQVGADDGREYLFLMHALFRCQFNPDFGNDMNRWDDGIQLREIWSDKMFYYYEDDFPCTFLEVLMGIAIRMQDMTDDTMEYWFWVLIKNLGLEELTDDEYYEYGGTEHVMVAVETVNTRTYSRYGVGGLFPLKHTTKDQRKVEIWYQMCSWLEENYEF